MLQIQSAVTGSSHQELGLHSPQQKLSEEMLRTVKLSHQFLSLNKNALDPHEYASFVQASFLEFALSNPTDTIPTVPLMPSLPTTALTRSTTSGTSSSNQNPHRHALTPVTTITDCISPFGNTTTTKRKTSSHYNNFSESGISVISSTIQSSSVVDSSISESMTAASPYFSEKNPMNILLSPHDSDEEACSDNGSSIL